MTPRTSNGAPAESRYSDQRPYVVVDRLDDLKGPTGGTVDLDPRMHWSGRTDFDLDKPRRLAVFYETVLREATTPSDLARWLDRATLIELWPRLVIPPKARIVWETRFPALLTSKTPQQ